MAKSETAPLDERVVRMLSGALGLTLAAEEARRLTPQVNGIFQFLQELWEEDLGETEPSCSFAPEA